MDSVTVTGAVANVSTTFGDLLLGGGASPWTLVAISIASATVGMVSHWIKIVYKDQNVDLSVFEYFFIQNGRASLTAFMGVLAGLFASFAPLDYTTISAYQVLTQAFAVGYAADSVFNSVAPSTPPKDDTDQGNQ